MSAYDSDDSDYSDYESTVHLGLPDGGPLTKSDHSVIEVSRIGGQPVRNYFCNHLDKLLIIRCSRSRVCAPFQTHQAIYAKFAMGVWRC